MISSIKLPAHTIVGIGLLLVTLAVNISMPLFSVYAAASHLNNVQTSFMFAAYVLGMLPCYIFLGGLSDRIGRRPIMLLSVIFAFLSTLIITLWPNAMVLAVARFLQGIALGFAMGTGAAYISELLQHTPNANSKTAALTSIFTAFGFGGGALATSVVLLLEFTLVPITYYMLICITFLGFLVMLTLPKLKPIGGNLIRLPYFPLGSLPVNIAIGICWGATGIIIAIIPTQLAKFGLTPYAGFCLVLVNWTGAFIQPLIKNVNPVKSVRIGLLLVPLGFALVIIGCNTGQLIIICLGAAVVGMAAYGFSYIGGLSIIANLGGKQKARAVSGYMFFGYIGFGIPAICLGYIADNFGVIIALIVFEFFIVILSVLLAIHFYKKNTMLTVIN